MEGAVVTGTVEVPSNTEGGDQSMVINVLPPPEEGGPQPPAHYTILDQAVQLSGAGASGTIEDDLDISDDSDDGDKQQRVAIPLVPFGGMAAARGSRQPPPGAMSVRVQ